MFDDYEHWVDWCDPKSAEEYGSGPGPFRVVHVKKDKFAECTCGGKGGGLLENGHSSQCKINRKPVERDVYIVVMNGRHRSFSSDLFKTIPSLRRR